MTWWRKIRLVCDIVKKVMEIIVMDTRTVEDGGVRINGTDEASALCYNEEGRSRVDNAEVCGVREDLWEVLESYKDGWI